MYPDMLYDGQKPADPVTLDVYPSGKTTFSLYEDDGTTQKYRAGGFARMTITVESPATPDAAGDTISVNVGPATGEYDGMPGSRRYLVDVHATRKPAKVTVGGRALAEISQTGQGRQAQDKLKADFEAATEGWYYDAADRRGVLHVKLGPQALSKGFTVVIGL
jgi:alpha-glucosidase